MPNVTPYIKIRKEISKNISDLTENLSSYMCSLRHDMRAVKDGGRRKVLERQLEIAHHTANLIAKEGAHYSFEFLGDPNEDADLAELIELRVEFYDESDQAKKIDLSQRMAEVEIRLGVPAAVADIKHQERLKRISERQCLEVAAGLISPDPLKD